MRQSMRSNSSRAQRHPALAGLGLIALFSLALTVPTLAQDAGTPPGGFGGGPGVPPPDGFGGGPGGPPPDGFGGGPGEAPPDGFGGGQGANAQATVSSQNQSNGAAPNDAVRAFGGRRGTPFVTGTVQAVDASASTLTLTTRSGTQMVKIGEGAQVVTQRSVSLSDLKVGDQIAVQGVPTGLTVSQGTVGQAPAGLPGMGGGPGGGGPPAGPQSQNAAVGADNSTAMRPALGDTWGSASFATARGTVKALPTASDPHLTLALGKDVVLYVKVASDAKFTGYVSLAITDTRVGDRVMATGQTGQDGTMTATVVGVNLPQPMGDGPGGRDRRRFGPEQAATPGGPQTM